MMELIEGALTSGASRSKEAEQTVVDFVKEAGLEHVLILVGGGLSQAFGLPSWDDNNDNEGLFSKLCLYGYNAKNKPRDAVLGRNTLPKRLGKALTPRSQFKPGPTHRLLIMSGARGILTTNYDQLIEMSLDFAPLPTKPTNRLHKTTPWTLNWHKLNTCKHPFLLKLHGDMDESDVIISKEDYEAIKDYADPNRSTCSSTATQSYEDRRIRCYVECIKSLFPTHLIISFGFSWSDDDALNGLLKISKSVFENNAMPHVAAMPADPNLVNNFCPVLQFYCWERSRNMGAIGHDKEYQDIWHLLSEIARYSRPLFPNFSIDIDGENVIDIDIEPEYDLATPFWLYPAMPRPETLKKKEDACRPRMLYLLHPVYNAYRKVTDWLERHAKLRQERLKGVNQVVQCYGLEISDDLVPRYALVCEYLDGWERWADLKRDNHDEVKDLFTRVELAIEVTKAMNECHKHGFKHGLFSGEAVWVGPPDSDGRRGVKLDGFEWYSLPDPIFRKAVAAARKEGLAPEVSKAMEEESESTSLYDGKLPKGADIYSLARFVEICLDEADREKTDWRKIDSDKNLANWLQQAAGYKKESCPADLTELVYLLDKLGTAIR